MLKLQKRCVRLSNQSRIFNRHQHTWKCKFLNPNKVMTRKIRICLLCPDNRATCCHHFQGNLITDHQHQSISYLLILVKAIYVIKESTSCLATDHQFHPLRWLLKEHLINRIKWGRKVQRWSKNTKISISKCSSASDPKIISHHSVREVPPRRIAPHSELVLLPILNLSS